jgi:hypothetical protein
MRLLEQSRRSKHPVLKYCTAERIKQLGNQFKAQANKSDAQLENLIQEFRLILTTLGFIRRTIDSRWFGHALVKVPPEVKMDMACQLPQPYLGRIKQIQSAVLDELNQLSADAQQARADGGKVRLQLSPAGSRKLGQLRILTSFPGLLDLATDLLDGDLEKLAWSQTDLDRLGWIRNPAECPIRQNLDMVLKGSSKFEYLCNMINEGLTDYNKRPEKFLFMTKHPVTVYILSLVSPYPIPNPLPVQSPIDAHIPVSY